MTEGGGIGEKFGYSAVQRYGWGIEASGAEARVYLALRRHKCLLHPVIPGSKISFQQYQNGVNTSEIYIDI
jgi:hypothetical protein